MVTISISLLIAGQGVEAVRSVIAALGKEGVGAVKSVHAAFQWAVQP